MQVSLSTFYALSFLTAALAFAFAAYLYLWVKKHKVQNAQIQNVAQLIKEGANTFMRREYRILAAFAAVAAVLIFVFLPAPILSRTPSSVSFFSALSIELVPKPGQASAASCFVKAPSLSIA